MTGESAEFQAATGEPVDKIEAVAQAIHATWCDIRKCSYGADDYAAALAAVRTLRRRQDA